MKIEDFLKKTQGWIKSTGPASDIVVSSRIRLARNLKEFPFADWSSKKDRELVLEKVKQAVDRSSYFKGSLFLRLGELDSIDRQFLLERQLISWELASKKNAGAVCISDKEIFSVMINEEDHLRLQVIQSGFDFPSNWRIIDRIDNELGANLDFAYSSRLGFLTACPTNAGTGMRASAMLHLPALVMNRTIERILEAVDKLNFNTRGLHGEGTEAAGNLFQISNQISLGRNELSIVNDIEVIVGQVIEQEKSARNKLLKYSRSDIENEVWRAYGTMKNARLISSDEVIGLLSMVRLGVDLGFIKEIDHSFINELFVLTHPAHLQKLAGKTLTPKQRDIKRAELIRERLR